MWEKGSKMKWNIEFKERRREGISTVNENNTNNEPLLCIRFVRLLLVFYPMCSHTTQALKTLTANAEYMNCLGFCINISQKYIQRRRDNIDGYTCIFYGMENYWFSSFLCECYDVSVKFMAFLIFTCSDVVGI